MGKTNQSGGRRFRLAVAVPAVALAVGAASFAFPAAAQAATTTTRRSPRSAWPRSASPHPTPTILKSTRVVSYVKLPKHHWVVTDRAKVGSKGCARVAYRRAGTVLFRAEGTEQITGANEAGTNCRVNVYRTHFGTYRGAKPGWLAQALGGAAPGSHPLVLPEGQVATSSEGGRRAGPRGRGADRVRGDRARRLRSRLPRTPGVPWPRHRGQGAPGRAQGLGVVRPLRA